MPTTANLDRFNGNAYRYFDFRTVAPCQPDVLVCGCGALARIKIQEEPHCWDCAEEVGIERVR